MGGAVEGSLTGADGIGGTAGAPPAGNSDAPLHHSAAGHNPANQADACYFLHMFDRNKVRPNKSFFQTSEYSESSLLLQELHCK